MKMIDSACPGTVWPLEQCSRWRRSHPSRSRLGGKDEYRAFCKPLCDCFCFQIEYQGTCLTTYRCVTLLLFEKKFWTMNPFNVMLYGNPGFGAYWQPFTGARDSKNQLYIFQINSTFDPIEDETLIQRASCRTTHPSALD